MGTSFYYQSVTLQIIGYHNHASFTICKFLQYDGTLKFIVFLKSHMSYLHVKNILYMLSQDMKNDIDCCFTFVVFVFMGLPSETK